MSIDGVSGRTSYIGSGILNLRSQLDSLTEQLASGKIATTYAGQGSGRSLALGIRAQLNAYSSYADTATNVNTRINVANLSLQRLVAINSDVKGAAVSAGSTIDNTGQTAGQKTANLDFFDSVDMLNAQSGDRYLFGGRITDAAPVAAADQILNGNGAAIAGLKQVISERKLADLGVNANGRVGSAVGVLPAAPPTSVSVTEEELTAPAPATAQPFGMKVSAVSTNIVGATVTQPSVPVSPAPAAQKAMSVDLGATLPKEGDTIKFTFKMPDGTSEDIVMTATTTLKTPMDANTFLIGADTAATAANLNTELGKSMTQLANGAMAAASAVQAGQNFFDDPPQRVGGAPNFGASTTLVDGSAADTVIWYTGETEAPPPAPADPARGTAVARIDDAITVRYGARANEQALRTQLQNVAVFAAVTTNVSDVNANGKIAALNQRIAQNLAVIPGTQTIQDIQADFAGAQSSIKATTDRQAQSKVISQTMLDSIEGINNDEVATKILALQTALQASYQTTSDLYKMSLVKFL
ncbi:flagellin-like hook-associated protein FlgL [Rhodopseudomonas rhenobacensis]|uniref:Flagellin-like hook-associated protein FlgL n=1 Tax=Rhodopseudomonas rhenobacensis TaxID=87461 RepID=A0A7W7Z3Y4_9BRAD|nr:flagellar biosynthesis protein FlgL [Rhodopseudomonas rhenobacensis]MBB5047546.1 flagellin-like hook-associated protein FlgL [Rhodopseudomonas rhenobacensis]